MNDVVVERLKRYGVKTAEREKEALREIIQEIALLGLWRAKFFEHAAFYGGTALRILYGLDRFSEDLDFTLRKLAPDFELRPYCASVREELSGYGFDANVECKPRSTQSSVESAFIKADTCVHMIRVGSRFRATKGELLKVKFEIDTAPALGFGIDARQFFWPIPFSVTTCDLPSLFSGKLHALLCRERIKNLKGRDIYDFLWYVGRGVKPNYIYLENKLRQTGHWPEKSEFSPAGFRAWARRRLEKVDIAAAKKDVERFITNPKALDGWGRDNFLAALDQI